MNRTDIEKNKKNKVLILGKVPPPYFGPAVATQIILDSSLKNNYQLIHLDTRLNKSMVTMGRWSMVKPFKSILIYLKMIRLIQYHQPQLVLLPISQSTPGFLKDSFYILIAWIFRRKVLLHLRGSNLQNWLNSISFMMRGYAEWFMRRCQGAIVLGNNLKSLFEKYFPDDRIFVVPNGGSYRFPATSATAVNDRVNVLYLSNLMPSKGIRDVIETVRLLTKEDRMNSNKLLVEVVGEWRHEKLRDEMMRTVEENKLPVVFHPAAEREKKLEFFSKADIFVFPPCKPEGHPWVIVEAMAAGLPIISTDQGAIVESVIHGENGFIVEPNNPRQIAEKISFLIENPDIREKMGAKSRKRYLENFTEEKMIERLQRVFESVIG